MLGPELLVKNYILFIFTHIFIDNLTMKYNNLFK